MLRMDCSSPGSRRTRSRSGTAVPGRVLPGDPTPQCLRHLPANCGHARTSKPMPAKDRSPPMSRHSRWRSKPAIRQFPQCSRAGPYRPSNNTMRRRNESFARTWSRRGNGVIVIRRGSWRYVRVCRAREKSSGALQGSIAIASTHRELFFSNRPGTASSVAAMPFDRFVASAVFALLVATMPVVVVRGPADALPDTLCLLGC